MKLLGLHNVYNALAGLLSAKLIEGRIDKKWKKSLWETEGEEMRTQIFHKDNITIINDAYNANPSSMKAAFSTLSLFKGRRIVVLGDMLELGRFSKKLHQEVGKEARRIADLIIGVGKYAKFYTQKGGVYFREKREAVRFLKDILRSRDVVLIKGSRAMGMEEIVSSLMGD